MPAFTITEYTDTSVTISVTGITAGWQIRFYIRKDPDPGSSVVDQSFTATGSSMVQQFSGLTPNTKYACNVRDIGGPGWYGAQYFTTKDGSESPDIKPWSWGASNGSASVSQTANAYSAVTGHGFIYNFSYLVWNDLVDKANEIIDAAGGSWDAKYDTYASTKMSASDKSLTAKRFNSLVHNIGAYYQTGISAVSRGDTVYGRYFTDLADCLNGWISQL